jgi:hypothetical protein
VLNILGMVLAGTTALTVQGLVWRRVATRDRHQSIHHR